MLDGAAPKGRRTVRFLDPAQRQQLHTGHRVASVGLEIVIATMIGQAGGAWLDGYFGTAPILGWIGLGLGLAAGLKSLIEIGVRLRADARRAAGGPT